MNLKEAKLKAYELINQYPKSKNGQPYLVMKNGKKLFFNLFVRKYGIDDRDVSTKYNDQDIKRRIYKVEFFKYFVSEFETLVEKESHKIILESPFHRMIILIRKVGISKKYELLSFYPK